jgi:hypothetical protein
MARPLDDYTPNDLELLAERFKNEGIMALIDITYVEGEKTKRLGKLSDVVWDALLFAAESKKTGVQESK